MRKSCFLWAKINRIRYIFHHKTRQEDYGFWTGRKLHKGIAIFKFTIFIRLISRRPRAIRSDQNSSGHDKLLAWAHGISVFSGSQMMLNITIWATYYQDRSFVLTNSTSYYLRKESLVFHFTSIFVDRKEIECLSVCDRFWSSKPDFDGDMGNQLSQKRSFFGIECRHEVRLKKRLRTFCVNFDGDMGNQLSLKRSVFFGIEL